MVASGANAAPTVITAMGDSLTQGYGLTQGAGFVPQLQAWLTAQGADTRVINAGVSGDTTAGGAARVGWTMADDPDAVIVAFGGNDVLRGLPPEAARENLETILTAVGDRPVLLIGIAAPGNYGADYKQAFEALYPDLAQKFGALLIPNFLGPLADVGIGEALGRYMQSDGVHPNADGVKVIVETVGPKVLELIGQVQSRG